MAIFKKENGQLVDFSNPIPDTSIAPIENGATSTHNYVVGAYALVKGILKKVTNAISIGTAFSDSNSETTDVATELKELNDDVTTINTHLRAKAEFSLDGWGSVAGDNYVDLTRAINIPTGYVVDSVEFMSNASCYMSTYFVNSGTSEVAFRVWNSTANAHGFDVNDKLVVHYK